MIKGGDFVHKRHKYKVLKDKQNITGEMINFYRTQKGLSAQQLSDKLIMMGLDIHRQAIFAIESGKRTVADYELCLIAEVLGIPTNELLKNFIEQIRKENY